jgi:hypothetical protein
MQRNERSLATGDVAQLVEHLLCKQGAGGSSPPISSLILQGFPHSLRFDHVRPCPAKQKERRDHRRSLLCE